MSATDVKALYDLGQSSDYLEFGVGEKKAGHKEAGTNRLAPGFYCDAPSVEAFIEMGNRLAEQNGRKVKAHSYVVSWSPDELDVNDPEDLKRGGDLAFLFAKKMRPDSPCLVVVHDDGAGAAGGCVHAHIVILNHDLVTGKAPRDFRVHWQVKKANDELMREHGMDVIVPKHKTSQGSYWAEKRGDMAEFDKQLGDAIAQARDEALADPSVVDVVAFDVAFNASCATRGVEVVKKDFEVKSDNRQGRQKGDTAVGTTYHMYDGVTSHRKPRWRRRKASSLSSEFTTDGLVEAFVNAAQQRAQLIATSATGGKAANRARLVQMRDKAAQQPRKAAANSVIDPPHASSAGTGISDQRTATEPEQEHESVDEIALRLRRKLAERKPKTPARQRHLARGQRQPQWNREYGE